jgi:integrase
MATGRLSAAKVAALVRRGKRGYTCDGGGLYLQISKYGTASWAFRYRIGGKPRETGLGAFGTWSLAEARERARKLRQQVGEGIDPIDAKRAKRAREKVEAAKAMTFRDCAEGYIASQQETWKSPVHRAQWPASLAKHAYPVFGDLPVAAIDTALVTKALEPIWTKRPTTASRVRARIETTLDWAKVRGYREGENPARWRGHLDKLLPRSAKAMEAVQRAKGRDGHHRALPYLEISEFMAALRGVDGIAARALEFAILTAARTGEVIGARWGEFDTENRLWTIPANRMKAGKEHRVPLSDAALAIVGAMEAIRQGEHVFAGKKAGEPLSQMALLMTLRRMGRGDTTTHGFRSSFRDWAAERTNFPAEVAEMALAHAVGDKVEAAYRRGDLFAKRRRIMDAWAKFCAAPPTAGGGKVVALHEAVA